MKITKPSHLKGISLAERQHPNEIYQQAVQSPDDDALLVQNLYRRCRGFDPIHLREDFCGTAAMLGEWIKLADIHTGEGVDNDPEPLEWGKAHNFEYPSSERAILHLADVRAPSTKAPDVRCAFNFSYWVFKTRGELLNYFESARLDLADDGVFLLDMHGGYECLEEEEVETDMGDFISVWHQTNVCPVDNSADLAIHYRFPDGSEIHNAYQYHWRIWSLPEILELLSEAGFEQHKIFWYIDEDDQLEYVETDKGWNDPAWIACIAAMK